MRCNCLECVSNDGGYCCNGAIEIDENGECSYLYVPYRRNDKED